MSLTVLAFAAATLVAGDGFEHVQYGPERCDQRWSFNGEVYADLGGGPPLTPVEIVEFAMKAGFTGPEEVSAIGAVTPGESAGCPKAYHVNSNGTRDIGLMQINEPQKRFPRYDPENPYHSMLMARVIYQRERAAGRTGVQPWLATRSPNYERYYVPTFRRAFFNTATGKDWLKQHPPKKKRATSPAGPVR